VKLDGPSRRSARLEVAHGYARGSEGTVKAMQANGRTRGKKVYEKGKPAARSRPLDAASCEDFCYPEKPRGTLYFRSFPALTSAWAAAVSSALPSKQTDASKHPDHYGVDTLRADRWVVRLCRRDSLPHVDWTRGESGGVFKSGAPRSLHLAIARSDLHGSIPFHNGFLVRDFTGQPLSDRFRTG